MTVGPIDTSRHESSSTDQPAVTETSTRPRLAFVDYMKCIGILLIVYGHIDPTETERCFLWTFNVPLFFFISGFLTKQRWELNGVRKKVERLLIPYFFIYAITTFYVFANVFVLTRRFVPSDLVKTLVGALWGSHGYSHFVDAPLWFLPSLFTVELLFLLRHTRFWWVLLGVPIASLLLYSNGFLNLFMSIDLSLLGFNYYTAGYIARYYSRVERLHKTKVLVLAAAALVFFSLVAWVASHGNVWYAGPSAGAYFVSFAGGIAGCLMVGAVGMCLERLLGDFGPVTYISQNTLLILGFHNRTNGWARSLINSIVSVPDGWKAAVYFTVSLVMLIPLLMLINRVVPQLGGSRVNLHGPGTDTVSRRKPFALIRDT